MFIVVGPYSRVNTDHVTAVTYLEEEKRLIFSLTNGLPYNIDLSAIEEEMLKQYLDNIFKKLQ